MNNQGDSGNEGTLVVRLVIPIKAASVHLWSAVSQSSWAGWLLNSSCNCCPETGGGGGVGGEWVDY